jgi:hypothetical protein
VVTALRRRWVGESRPVPVREPAREAA